MDMISNFGLRKKKSWINFLMNSTIRYSGKRAFFPLQLKPDINPSKNGLFYHKYGNGINFQQCFLSFKNGKEFACGKDNMAVKMVLENDSMLAFCFVRDNSLVRHSSLVASIVVFNKGDKGQLVENMEINVNDSGYIMKADSKTHFFICLLMKSRVEQLNGA